VADENDKSIVQLLNEIYPSSPQEFLDEWTIYFHNDAFFTVKDLVDANDENWEKILSGLPLGVKDKIQKKFPRKEQVVEKKISWQDNINVNAVSIKGEWDSWTSPITLYRDQNEWSAIVKLTPGTYSCKFIVDGNWLASEYLPKTEDLNSNNIISVKLSDQQSVQDYTIPPVSELEKLANQLRELIEKNFQLEEKTTQLEEKTTQLEEKNVQLEEKTVQLEEKNVQLAEKTRQLEEKNVQLEREIKGFKELSAPQQDTKKQIPNPEHLSVESQEEEGADQPDPIQQPSKLPLEEGEEQPSQSLEQSDMIPYEEPAPSQKTWLQTLGLSPINLFIDK